MLHVHKDRADALNLIDVPNDFIDGSYYRLSIFDTFQETDLKRAQVLVKTKSTQVSFLGFIVVFPVVSYKCNFTFL